MITITVNNVWGQLSDYTPELEYFLSVAHEGYFFSPQYKAGLWDGRTHFLKIPSLKFPTGLLFMIEEFFNNHGIEYMVVDQREKIEEKFPLVLEKDLLIGITLRDYQLQAIWKALKLKYGVIECPTGSGKTEIAAGIILMLNQRTLFLVHTQDLLRQTIERFSKRLERPIGKMGEGVVDVNDKDIVVATVQTLNSLLTRRPDETKRFLNSFKVLFLDECHHSSAASWYRICQLAYSAYYRFGLSGTVLRRDELSNMKMLALFGAPIYRMSTMELSEQGYLSPIEMRVLDNPETITGEGTYRQVYTDGVVRSLDRNTQIVNTAVAHYKAGKKVMVLVRQLEHGRILRRMLVNTHHVPAEFLCGATWASERDRLKSEFNKTGEFVLIASTIFDEGVDIPEINVLIIAAGGKSEVKTIQRVGRGLRRKKDNETLIVYDFMDHSKYLREHSQKRFRTYRKENFMKS